MKIENFWKMKLLKFLQVLLTLSVIMFSDIIFRFAVEGVYLTSLRHIFSVQVKSGACHITGQWWGRVKNKIKET